MPERRIYSHLASSTGVTSLLASGRASVSPMRARQAAAMPYIVYQRIDSVPFNHSTGYTDSQTARIQIDGYAETYAAMKQLGTAVREALRGYRSSTGTPVIDMCHQESEQDLSEQLEPGQDAVVYRNSQDWLVDFTTT